MFFKPYKTQVSSNNPFYTHNAAIPKSNKAQLIMRSLILLYGMEKGIKNALIYGVYDIKSYYLQINNSLISFLMLFLLHQIYYLV